MIERPIPLPKLFADTSRISEIEKLLEFGFICGITTNPVIVANEAKSIEPNGYYKDLAKRFPDLPISIQLLDEDVPTLVKQAHTYTTISPNIVIKVPMFGDGRGLTAVSQLVKDDIRVNVTALMNAEQALLVLMAGNGKGPAYLSLFFNRIKDGGGNPQNEIKRSRALVDGLGSNSEIITGSIRRGSDVYEAVVAGTHIVTVQPKVIWEMVHHDKSVEFINQSQEAWENLTKDKITAPKP